MHWGLSRLTPKQHGNGPDWAVSICFPVSQTNMYVDHELRYRRRVHVKYDELAIANNAYGGEVLSTWITNIVRRFVQNNLLKTP